MSHLSEGVFFTTHPRFAEVFNFLEQFLEFAQFDLFLPESLVADAHIFDDNQVNQQTALQAWESGMRLSNVFRPLPLPSSRSLTLCLLLSLILSACVSPQQIEKSVPRELAGERRQVMSVSKFWLKDFKSDGCSNFPEGIPYYNDKLWLHCCVEHDVAYWKGGTDEERTTADLALKKCVAETGQKEIAEAMYIGVRSFGSPGLPTTWKWGYGWIPTRPSVKLSEEEQEIVRALQARIPTDISKIELVSPPIFTPIEESQTNDYCLDAVTTYFRLKDPSNKAIKIIGERTDRITRFAGLLKTVSVLVDSCPDPYEFVFLLATKNACVTKKSEIAKRLQVYLKSIQVPERCKFEEDTLTNY